MFLPVNKSLQDIDHKSEIYGPDGTSTSIIGTQSMILIFEANDIRNINSDFPEDLKIVTAFTFCLLLIFITNSLVFSWLKVKEYMLVDTMVMLDCFTNILVGIVLLLAFPKRIFRNIILCSVITWFRFTILYLKRYYYLF